MRIPYDNLMIPDTRPKNQLVVQVPNTTLLEDGFRNHYNAWKLNYLY